MRISNRQMMRGYMNSVQSATMNNQSAIRKVLTGQRYTKVSENVSVTTKALRKNDMLNQNARYLENVKDSKTYLSDVEEQLTQVSDVMVEFQTKLKEAQSPTLNEQQREAIAKELETMKSEIMSAANSSNGSSYLFGSGSSEQPFTYNDAGDLLFQGVAIGDNNSQFMSNENYVDVGYGLTFSNGHVDPGSAMNLGINGQDIFGHGTTEVDGDQIPNNIIELIDKAITDVRANDTAAMSKNLDQAVKATNKVLNGVSDVGSKMKQLETLEDKYSAKDVRLKDEIKGMMGISYEEAISEQKQAEFVYNLTLKMGASIIPTSIFDFMR